MINFDAVDFSERQLWRSDGTVSFWRSVYIQCRKDNKRKKHLFFFSSDDELEPYDMSHDTKVTKVKVPVYVRDCMDGKNTTFQDDKTQLSSQFRHNYLYCMALIV